jgi:orotidine-5'-phosphate decarboxylase
VSFAQRFDEKLAAAWKASNSLVCVGLDPEPKKFPDQLRDAPGSIFAFNKAIVDATADLVCAYKPQFAHYAAHAAENQLSTPSTTSRRAARMPS